MKEMFVSWALSRAPHSDGSVRRPTPVSERSPHRRAPGPRIDLESASERDTTGMGSSSRSNDFWDDDSDEREREGESYNEQKKKHHEKVVNTIKNMIGQDMWEPEGKGSIRVLNNKLVISQTLLGFKMLEQALR